jgi:hypothetical protein
MSEARRIAAEYRRATGKSLGISSEIARHDACRLLNLEAVESSCGYDAVELGKSPQEKIQIKGRVIFDATKTGLRVGQLKLEQEWDAVVLVLLDDSFDTTEIYRADRQTIMEALEESVSATRSKRGAMSVNRFKRISTLVWDNVNGLSNEDSWTN